MVGRPTGCPRDVNPGLDELSHTANRAQLSVITADVMPQRLHGLAPCTIDSARGRRTSRGPGRSPGFLTWSVRWLRRDHLVGGRCVDRHGHVVLELHRDGE